MTPIRGKRLFVMALIPFLVVSLLPLSPVQGALLMAQIKAFQASCSAFSVDVTVQGLTNDQDGFDRFRYQVTDGAGNLLYQEDSARQVGVSDRAFVVSLPYVHGTVAVQNPIRFEVIDLDILARPMNTVITSVTESLCFADASPEFRLAQLLAEGIKGFTSAEAALYSAPHTDPLPLSLPAKRELTALYRSVDGQWAAVYVGGESLVWVRALDFEVDWGALRVMPTQLDGSQQVSGVVLPGVPLATARLRYTLNLRLGPGTNFQRIGKIPYRTIVPVYGRSGNSGWVLISYRGVTGWISSAYITLEGTPLNLLPIVG